MVVKPVIAQMSPRYIINYSIIKSDKDKKLQDIGIWLCQTQLAALHLILVSQPLLARSILEEGVGVVAEDAEGVVAALSEEAFHGFEGSVHLW